MLVMHTVEKPSLVEPGARSNVKVENINPWNTVKDDAGEIQTCRDARRNSLGRVE